MDLTIKDADSLLGEIHAESLQTLLTSIRATQATPPRRTHIPGLDAHLAAAAGVQSTSSLRPGDVVEIQGPSGSGKTHLAYHFVMTCILPSSFMSTPLGGWDKSAIVFDTDGSFDVVRLGQLLRSRIRRMLALRPEDAAFVDQLCVRTLDRVVVFRPTSTSQLAATLFHLPVYHSKHMQDHEIGLVVVDSISAHYWPDRFTAEQMRSAPAQARRSGIAFNPPLQNILDSLQQFCRSHLAVILLTNWGINPLPKQVDLGLSAPVTLYRQHLHPFLSALEPLDQPPHANSSNIKARKPFPVSHHITLPLVPTCPFPAGISIIDAKKEDVNNRSNPLEEGKVVGIIRTAGSSTVGNFVFYILHDEIIV